MATPKELRTPRQLTRRSVSHLGYTHGFDQAIDGMTTDGSPYPTGPDDPRWLPTAAELATCHKGAVSKRWAVVYRSAYVKGARGAIRHFIAKWSQCPDCKAAVLRAPEPGQSLTAFLDELDELHWSSCPLAPGNQQAPQREASATELAS